MHQTLARDRPDDDDDDDETNRYKRDDGYLYQEVIC